MTLQNDSYHPILDRPWDYELYTLSYFRPNPDDEPFIDILLKHNDAFKALRFLNPKDIEIHKGFPHQTHICIFDVSNRGVAGFNVRVDSPTGENGAVRFWAREVITCGSFTR